VWVEAAEAANPGGQLADAAHELGSGVYVHAGALVGHALLVGGTGPGAWAGDGDAAHPRGGGVGQVDAVVCLGMAARTSWGGGGRRRAEEVEEAVGAHGWSEV
jgi:hypothetical protein